MDYMYGWLVQLQLQWGMVHVHDGFRDLLATCKLMPYARAHVVTVTRYGAREASIQSNDVEYLLQLDDETPVVLCEIIAEELLQRVDALARDERHEVAGVVELAAVHNARVIGLDRNRYILTFLRQVDRFVVLFDAYDLALVEVASEELG